MKKSENDENIEFKTEYITNVTSKVAYKIDKWKFPENPRSKIPLICPPNISESKNLSIRDKSTKVKSNNFKPLILSKPFNKTIEKSNLILDEENELNYIKNSVEKHKNNTNFLSETKNMGFCNSTSFEPGTFSKTTGFKDMVINENKIMKETDFEPFLSSEWYNDVDVKDLPWDIIQEEPSPRLVSELNTKEINFSDSKLSNNFSKNEKNNKAILVNETEMAIYRSIDYLILRKNQISKPSSGIKTFKLISIERKPISTQSSIGEESKNNQVI